MAYVDLDKVIQVSGGGGGGVYPGGDTPSPYPVLSQSIAVFSKENAWDVDSDGWFGLLQNSGNAINNQNYSFYLQESFHTLEGTGPLSMRVKSYDFSGDIDSISSGQISYGMIMDPTVFDEYITNTGYSVVTPNLTTEDFDTSIGSDNYGNGQTKNFKITSGGNKYFVYCYATSSGYPAGAPVLGLQSYAVNNTTGGFVSATPVSNYTLQMSGGGYGTGSICDLQTKAEIVGVKDNYLFIAMAETFQFRINMGCNQYSRIFIYRVNSDGTFTNMHQQQLYYRADNGAYQGNVMSPAGYVDVKWNYKNATTVQLCMYSAYFCTALNGHQLGGACLALIDRDISDETALTYTPIKIKSDYSFSIGGTLASCTSPDREFRDGTNHVFGSNVRPTGHLLPGTGYCDLLSDGIGGGVRISDVDRVNKTDLPSYPLWNNFNLAYKMPSRLLSMVGNSDSPVHFGLTTITGGPGSYSRRSDYTTTNDEEAAPFVYQVSSRTSMPFAALEKDYTLKVNDITVLDTTYQFSEGLAHGKYIGQGELQLTNIFSIYNITSMLDLPALTKNIEVKFDVTGGSPTKDIKAGLQMNGGTYANPTFTDGLSGSATQPRYGGTTKFNLTLLA